MRRAPCELGQTEAILAGDAGRGELRCGTGPCSVYIRCSCWLYAGSSRLYARDWRHAGRWSPDFPGQDLESAGPLLPQCGAVLRRSEAEALRRQMAGSSINKGPLSF
jgi:hypothetical protein